MAWAKTRPEALSERTGKPDTRGAYGLLAREVIILALLAGIALTLKIFGPGG